MTSSIVAERRPFLHAGLAIAVGAGIGAVLAAANVYTGLKVAFVDGGAIAASLLAFVLLRVWGQGMAKASSLNLAQATASTAASMVAIAGLAGPIPALHLAGQTFSTVAGVVWGCLLGGFGLWAGWLLRPLLLDRKTLPFPTGMATAGVIRAIEGDPSRRRAHLWTLLLVGLPAALWTFFRDGPWSVLPGVLSLPAAFLGAQSAWLAFGVSLSPLVAATGALVGVRVAASAALGGVFAWMILVPRLVEHAIVPEPDAGTSWLVWPALGLLLGASLTAFVAERRLAGRALLEAGAVLRTFAHRRGMFVLGAGLALGVAGMGMFVLGVHPFAVVVALVLALGFSLICGRAAGETDVAPVGTAGTVTQLAAATTGIRSTLLGGAITAGTAAAATQALWSLRTASLLRVRLPPVAVAQTVGVVVGAAIAMPAFDLVVRVYGLGTADMPAWGAQSWKATAEAMARGGSMPAWSVLAFWTALVVGAVLVLVQQRRATAWLPNPIGLGIGMMVPLSFASAMALGAVVLARWLRGRDETDVAVFAGAAIAGESITAIAIALGS